VSWWISRIASSLSLSSAGVAPNFSDSWNSSTASSARRICSRNLPTSTDVHFSSFALIRFFRSLKSASMCAMSGSGPLLRMPSSLATCTAAAT
jgi:hypothetical protein